MADIKTQDAVLRNLQIVAEATQRLSDELKAVHPGVGCVQNNLPDLKRKIEGILQELENES